MGYVLLAVGALAAAPVVARHAERGMVVWYPLRVSEGGIAVVEIESTPACAAAAVVWLSRFVPTAPRGDRRQALLPVGLATVGRQSLSVRCGRDTATVAVDVEPVAFAEAELSVAPRFSQKPPPRAAVESARMAAAMQGGEVERLWRESFLRPVPGPVTSTFGVRRVFNGVLQSQHRGLDLDGRVGVPVRAANDGRIALVAEAYYFPGNSVIVDHGAGLYTSYFHFSRIDVAQGEWVRRGQVLGAIGRTGRVTGPHLHFGVKLAGIYVDPEALLRFDPTAAVGGELTDR
jgi:murein DD-endopeptidase MepM/ murein hydrolase activator NlpD